jgi:hypothetical protein
MSDMPPAVERPLTPPGWGPSMGEAWGPRTSPAAGGAWGANSGADGWGAAQGATGWGGTAPTNAGWGDMMGGWDSGGAAAAGGWGVGMAPGSSSGTFIPPSPAATYAAGTWEMKTKKAMYLDFVVFLCFCYQYYIYSTDTSIIIGPGIFEFFLSFFPSCCYCC